MKKTISKSMSWLLSVVMIFGAFVAMPITANASTGGHTQAEAVQWVCNQEGNYFDSNWGYQCVNLIRAYYGYLGVPLPTGNANTYLSDSQNHKPAGWTINWGTGGLQPGDITVWDGGQYGHVAIVVELNSSYCTVMQQNGDGNGYNRTEASKCHYGKQYYSGITGYIHPDFNKTNKPSATNVGVSAGTSFSPTSFWWDTSENADYYNLKIWNGTYWVGDPYRIEWDIRSTGCSVQLPAGYYEAYVDSVNSEGWTISNNVVCFTVGDGKIDLGTNFYAYIINSESWKMAAVVGNNVQLQSETGFRNQLWYFERQDDLYYKITNVGSNGCLDVHDFGNTNGTNIESCVSNDSSAQRWGFVEHDGNYVLHPKCSPSMALDLNGGATEDGTNIQIWEANGKASQTFTIWKFDNIPSKPVVTSDYTLYSEGSDVMITWGENAYATSYAVDVWYNNGVSVEHKDNSETRNIEYAINDCKSGVYGVYITSVNPNGTSISDVYNFYIYKDIGNDSFAYVVNSPSEAYLINDNRNAYFDKTSGTKESQKVWHFSKNSDGSYSIKSMNDGNMLDMDIAFNVKTNELNTESISQQWFVFGKSPCYCIMPKSNIGGVLDLNGGAYYDNVNAQIQARNNTDAQKFNIISVNYTITYDMNGGTGSIESQNKTYGQKITISKTVPNRSGYEFLGWSTNKKATTAQYSAGGTFKTNGNTTLYAVWRANLQNTSTLAAKDVKLGTYVTVNTSATGGTGNYTYAVYYKKSSSTSWTKAQDYSTNSKVKIKPAKAVKYDVLVKVKDINGKIAEKTFTVNVFDALKNNSTVSSENIGFGDTVTVKAKATGGVGPYSYAIYYKKASSEKWSALQKYSDNTTVSFKPASATTYDVMVKVQDSRGTIVKKTLTVNVTKPENTSELSADTVKLGNSVSVSCSAKGGSGYYQYAVLYKKTSSEKWTTKQNYSSNTTVSIKPAAKATYDICVKVKDSLGNIAKKYFTVTVTK